MTNANTWERLRQAAFDVRAEAYAPYSNFSVGAALLSRDGRTFVGCNVENASYGASICAERGALTSAVAAGAREFAALVVATGARQATPPCGICRQALLEFAPNLVIRSYVEDGTYEEYVLRDLLPHAFDRSQLE